MVYTGVPLWMKALLLLLLLISSEAVVVLQVQALSGRHRWVENLESDEEGFSIPVE